MPNLQIGIQPPSVPHLVLLAYFRKVHCSEFMNHYISLLKSRVGLRGKRWLYYSNISPTQTLNILKVFGSKGIESGTMKQYPPKLLLSAGENLMPLSRKYYDNLVLRNLFQNQVYSKEIKIPTPPPDTHTLAV